MTVFLVLLIIALCFTFLSILVDLKKQNSELKRRLLAEQLKKSTPSFEDAVGIVNDAGFVVVPRQFTTATKP